MIVHRDIIVTIIKDKIIENLVRWYGYMQRWPLKALVRRVDCMVFSFVKRDGGRLRMTLEEIINRDFKVNNLP